MFDNYDRIPCDGGAVFFILADYDWLALNVVQRLIREFYRLSDNVDSTLSDKYHFLIFNVNKTRR